MNIQDWFSLGWTGLILQSKGLSRVISNSWKASILWHSAFFIVQLSHPYWKIHSFDNRDLCWQSQVSAFWYCCLFVIAFLPKSKSLLISWPQPPSAVTLEPKKIKSVTVATVSQSVCHEVMGLKPWSLFFECWALSQLFHSPLSLSSRGSLVSLHFLP